MAITGAGSVSQCKCSRSRWPRSSCWPERPRLAKAKAHCSLFRHHECQSIACPGFVRWTLVLWDRKAAGNGRLSAGTASVAQRRRRSMAVATRSCAPAQCKNMLAREHARITLLPRCTGAVSRVNITCRCWARGSSTFASSRTNSTMVLVVAQLLLRRSKKMLSARR